MKKVLVGYQGYIHEIREPGEDFEIYEGPGAAMMWVDAPDGVQLNWTLEYSPQKGHMVWVEREKPYTDPGMARKIAYGDVGEQLDMLYKDMVNGTSNWIEHIQNVKETLPPPQKNKPCGISTMDTPSWVRYPGWKGYTKD